MLTKTPLTKIAIFYDGTFFWKTHRYYRENHSAVLKMNFVKLHHYIRQKIGELEKHSDTDLCQIVEAHLFRGRFSLKSATEHNALEADRFQDQLLMYSGIVAHYYPMNEKKDPPEEKGIDVWLALESYDLAVHKKFDVMVLFAGDQDYVPLIRKMNGLGIRVMILGVDVAYQDDRGIDRFIKTSPFLMNDAWHVEMIGENTDIFES